MQYFYLLKVLVFYLTIQSNPTIRDRMNLTQVISSGGTLRLPRILAEIKYVIPKYPFFGVGPSSINETEALAKYTLDPFSSLSSHNFIFSALTQVGIIGFLAYMWFYVAIINETISKIRSFEIFIIPLMLILTGLFNGVGEIMYTERIFWNALSIACLCLTTYSVQEKFDARVRSTKVNFQHIEYPIK